jgi:hypothetical protein
MGAHTTEVKIADILRVLKQDEKKYLRMPYVLTMTQQMSKQKKNLRVNSKGDQVEM